MAMAQATHQPRKVPSAMKRLAALLAASLLLVTGLFAGPQLLTAEGASDGTAATAYGWGQPVGGDEFNYTGAPDPAKWSVYNSPGHAGKGLRRPSAWAVNGQYVRVTGDSAGTTGGMSDRTRGVTYGRWESRMRMSPNRAVQYHGVLIVWPDAGRVAANGCQEIDYSETTGQVNVNHFYLHYACPNTQVSASKTLDMTAWHTYAVDWQPGKITGYVDGVQWFTSTKSPKAPGHQTVQLDWFPNSSATTKSWMDVDWVRRYPATPVPSASATSTSSPSGCAT